mmetsp:Transcript_15300/g.28139  ORF Transcript_15300/g.28139 Transcript_15300/m.28139 type:complete len:211 (+) Transcript_15300:32-664(+)
MVMVSMVSSCRGVAGAQRRGLGRKMFSTKATIMSTLEALQVVDAGKIGKKAISRVPLKAGTILGSWDAPVEKGPTMHTVQFDSDYHVAPIDGAEFISHGCSGTNTKIQVAQDRKSARFVVTADVEEGADLFFNYNTTEWDMNSPFVCSCPACQAAPFPRTVRGFKHLSITEREEILHETSPYIKELAIEEASAHLTELEGGNNVASELSG